MATYAITGTILDLTGDPHAASSVRLRLESSEDFIASGASARTGGVEPIAVAADGTVNHDGIPETVDGAPMYRLHVDSTHLRAAGRGAGVTSGWFALPAGGITLGEIAETYFAPTLVEPGMYASIVELVAAAQAAADEASASAEDAESMVSGMETIALVGPVHQIGTLLRTNHWTATSPVEVALPSAQPGFQATVHIDGWEHVTWPAGTVLYGDTDATEVWVNLVREEAHWTVLVPDVEPPPAPEWARDSGWVTLVAGVSMDGYGTIYAVGSSAIFGSTPHWGPADVAPGSGEFLYFSVMARRIGDRVWLTMVNIEAKTGVGDGSLILDIPKWLSPGRSVDDWAAIFAGFPVARSGRNGLAGFGQLSVGTRRSDAFGATTDARAWGFTAGDIIGFQTGSSETDAGAPMLTWVTDSSWPPA